MNDYPKKVFVENEKGHTYNLNSFRGNSSHTTEKVKLEKEHKIVSPRVILQSIDKTEKEDTKNKTQYKPRLLTAKLPSAFDMKYKK
jgi:hypothetical protein